MDLPVRGWVITRLFATTRAIWRMAGILASSRARSPQISFAGAEHTLVAGIFAERMDGHGAELKSEGQETA